MPTSDQPVVAQPVLAELVLAQKYRLVRQLEVGGMGSVWLAEHVHLGSLVAVKLMGREVAATAVGTQRFLREARTAASLRSPNVVQILDYGVHDGTPFIAMELLEGESLAARLDRDGRFQSWERAEQVLRHVARAVGRAHDAGIIHRDLKPANIFLVRDEEEEVVKLLDFGIAKTTVEQLNVPGAETRTGEFLGSPTYSSPEQLQVSKTLDHRADIWSLGVIAYECLLGEPPFVSETLVGLVLDICSHPLPIPSQKGPVPAGFDAWFARACARDVEQRFPDVREASAELRRLVAAACALPASSSQVPPSPSASLPAAAPSPSPPSPPTSSAWPPAPASGSAARQPTTPLPHAPAALALPSAALALPPWVLSPERSTAPPAVRTAPTVRQAGRAASLKERFGTALARRSEAAEAGRDAPSSERWSERRMPALLLTGLSLLAVPLFWFALRTPAPLRGVEQPVAAPVEGRVDERVLGLAPPAPAEPAPGALVRSEPAAPGEAAPGDGPAGNEAAETTAAPTAAAGNAAAETTAAGNDMAAPAPPTAVPSPSVAVLGDPEPAQQLAHDAEPAPAVPAPLQEPAPSAPPTQGAKPARKASTKPARSAKAASAVSPSASARAASANAASANAASARPAPAAEPSASAVSPSAGLASSSSPAPDRAIPPASAPDLPPAPAPSAAAPSATAPGARAPASRRQARLTLTASTPSTVLLDGRSLGITPLADVSVAPGVHEITFSSDGERSAQKVELRAGEHKRVHASPPSSPGDGLDEAAVQRTLREYGPSVRDICWERALRGRPPTAAPSSVRVSARITVAPSGRVSSVMTSRAPADYPGLSRCIAERVRAWSFPPAPGETLVNVPFVFVDG